MWLQPLGPKESGQTGLWNRILNALGMGVVTVHLGPSVPSATGGGQAAYRVDLRNALQFLTAHKEVLCSMGIISRSEISKPLFSPEQVVRFIEGLYKIYFSEKEKLKQLNFYWMIKRSPELLAYLSSLGIVPPEDETGDELFRFMVGRVLHELSYEHEKFRPEVFSSLQERIEKKFFSEYVVRLSPMAKEAVRSLGAGAKWEGTVPSGSTMVHRFLADLSRAIIERLDGLPKKLQDQFDRLRLLGLEESEVIDFVRVQEFLKRKKENEEQWQAAYPDKPRTMIRHREEIVAFMAQLQTQVATHLAR